MDAEREGLFGAGDGEGFNYLVVVGCLQLGPAHRFEGGFWSPAGFSTDSPVSGRLVVADCASEDVGWVLSPLSFSSNDDGGPAGASTVSRSIGAPAAAALCEPPNTSAMSRVTHTSSTHGFCLRLLVARR
jgi:hypothetical protein